MEKNKGLYQKYEVKKLTNPDKVMDCIVLEFDDPISRNALHSYVDILIDHGYEELAKDIYCKLAEYERKGGAEGEGG